MVLTEASGNYLVESKLLECGSEAPLVPGRRSQLHDRDRQECESSAFIETGPSPSIPPVKLFLYPFASKETLLMAADIPEGSTVKSLNCNSYSTALAIFPPESFHRSIDSLRWAYDKSYPRWAPHITMAIPFVSPDELSPAVERILENTQMIELLSPFEITFEKTNHFSHKDAATVYLLPDANSVSRLQAIQAELEKLFNLPGELGDGIFRPHLTIGQAPLDELSISLLKEKAQMLLPLSWTVTSVSVIRKNEQDGGKMEVFGTVPRHTVIPIPPAFSKDAYPCCYTFNPTTHQYGLYEPPVSLFNIAPDLPSNFTLSTYNILHSPLQPQTTGSPRLSLLFNTILNHPATLLFLQEVTDVAWHYFLSKAALRQKYPYISAPKHLPLPNTRNIVVLSTIPFEAYYLPLLSPHKPALIVNCGPLTFAGVHLSAGLHEEKLALKFKELSKLTTYLESQGTPFVLVGDFNIPNRAREFTAALPKIHEILAAYTDAWTAISTESGDTFVPDQNRFAKEGTMVQYAQRHDRVYFSRGAGLRVLRAELFAITDKEDELGSDHWGISIDFVVEISEISETRGSDGVSEILAFDIPKTNWTDEELSVTLNDTIPIDEDNEKINTALALLNSILEPMSQQIPLRLQIVGSFGLGAHTKNSDLDILAVSTISQNLFWTIFLQHLQRYKVSNSNDRLKVLRIIKDAKTPMVELLIDAQKVEVQYCPAGRLLQIWDQVPYLSDSSDELHLSALTLRQLNAYRDDMTILNSVPNTETFCLARRAFKYFCSQRGIYGAKFGFLGGFAITILVAGICRCLPTDATASEVVSAAIKQYCEFSWETEILWFPGVEKGRDKREDRDVMYLSSIHKPTYNVMRNASSSTLHTIIHELKVASETMASASVKQIFGNGLDDFFQNYRTFVKVQCAFWGTKSAEGRKWLTWIESRLVILLVNLSKEFPALETRLWPARFGEALSNDVQGTYLIGVSGTGVNEGVFRGILRDVERSMRREDEIADRWVSVILCRGKDIIAEKLQVDTRIWDGEEEIILEEDMEETAEQAEEQTSPQQKVPGSEGKGGKLRPSHDVFNRLFWDETYSAEDYVVGYEDRFKGVMELPLTSWQKEFTDEEFIPFHRVVYFREKRGEGKIIWDRRTRVDQIFGSG